MRANSDLEQRGTTLVELLAVVAVIGLAALAVGVYSVDWLGRQEGRSAAYEILSNIQLAKLQAVSRNRQCRFVIDTASRKVRVLDLNDPSVPSDDILLGEGSLQGNIEFSHPLLSPPITLALISGSTWQATFSSDGSVSVGEGDVVLKGGEDWYRVSLYGAGGTRLSRWDGAAWVVGS